MQPMKTKETNEIKKEDNTMMLLLLFHSSIE